MKRAKRIEIIGAEDKDWYRDLIDCFFDVDTETEEGYGVTVGGLKGYYLVKKKHAKVFEFEDPSYVNDQVEWVKKNNLKIGSKIRLVCEFEEWKYAFDCYDKEGNFRITDYVYTIKEITDYYIKIEEIPYHMPYFAFKPVKDKAVL